MNPTKNQFLKDLDKRPWTAAGKLRSTFDAAIDLVLRQAEKLSEDWNAIL